jgi:uncharacterized membrane protein
VHPATWFDLMRSVNEREVARQHKRLETLEREERKLLQLAYAEARSVELVQEETKRIKQERQQANKVLAACAAEYDHIAAALDQALAMAINCHEAYTAAKPAGKRQLNQALFDKLYVTPDGIVAADLAEPFAQLLTHDLDQRL